MTLLFAGKSQAAARGEGGTKPKAYPPDAARPNRQTDKIRERVVGKGERKNYNNYLL